MSELNQSQQAAQEEFQPFLAGCNSLTLDAPWRWLRMGWQDFRRAPRCGLFYGAMVTLVSYVIFSVAWLFASLTAAIATMSAFVFLGPVMCLGLYSVARQLKRYPKANLQKSLRHGFKPYGDLSLFIVVLIVIALLWARAASMIHVFFPVGEENKTEELLIFLGVGSFIGSIFATLVFAVSAFSLPMILDKKVDMITCCVSSFNAVLRNKAAMLIWITIIVVLTAIGFVTFFIGFLFIIPTLGYATWHSYKETLVVDAWQDRIAEFTAPEKPVSNL